MRRLFVLGLLAMGFNLLVGQAHASNILNSIVPTFELELYRKDGKGKEPKILPDVYSVCDDGSLSMQDPMNQVLLPLLAGAPCTTYVVLTPDGYVGKDKDVQKANFKWSYDGRNYREVKLRPFSPFTSRDYRNRRYDSDSDNRNDRFSDNDNRDDDAYDEDTVSKSWVIPVNWERLRPGAVRITVQAEILSGTYRGKYAWGLIKTKSHDEWRDAGNSDVFLAAEYPLDQLPTDRNTILIAQSELLRFAETDRIPATFFPDDVIERIKVRTKRPLIGGNHSTGSGTSTPPSSTPPLTPDQVQNGTSVSAPTGGFTPPASDSVAPSAPDNNDAYNFNYLPNQAGKEKLCLIATDNLYKVTVEYVGQTVRSENQKKEINRYTTTLPAKDRLFIDWAKNLKVEIQTKAGKKLETWYAGSLTKEALKGGPR